MEHNNTQGRVLKIAFCFLVLLGISLAGVIVAVHFIKKQEIVPEKKSEVEQIVSRYQTKIDDKSTDDVARMNLYIDRAYELKKYMLETDVDLCEMIERDLNLANELDQSGEMKQLTASIMSSCVEKNDSGESGKEGRSKVHWSEDEG